MSAPGGLRSRSADLLAIRSEWLGHALSTDPADRPAAEEAVSSLYGATGRPPPRFVWVDSPKAATKVLPAKEVRRFDGDCRTAEAEIANGRAALRASLQDRTSWHRDIAEIVREPLRLTVRQGLLAAVKITAPAQLGLGWTGQHDVEWIADIEAHRRFGEARFRRGDLAELAVWAALARATGWWWPTDDLCVMAQRPVVVCGEHTDEGFLLHNGTGPAVAFADGSAAYAWRGTVVPSWVVEEPTAQRILTERNVEFRRCAIERVGWEAFIAEAGLAVLGAAPDPGNPDHELLLYDLPAERARLLLAVNGSVERDGTRRRYGLRVPDWFDDPIEAAAWSYGLTGPQYAQMRRRT